MKFHNLFKQAEQLNADDLGTKNKEFDIFNELNMTLVSENGRVYKQKNTLDYGFSLFVTNLGMINTSQMMRENLPLNMMQHIMGKNDTKQVTPLFRSLFFLYENGMTSLNSLGLIQEEYI